MSVITLRFPPDAPVVVSIRGNGATFRRLEPRPDGSYIAQMTRQELLAVTSDRVIMDFVKWLRERGKEGERTTH